MRTTSADVVKPQTIPRIDNKYEGQFDCDNRSIASDRIRRGPRTQRVEIDPNTFAEINQWRIIT